MMMEYYVVAWKGTFGFIKPWTAVRDGETFSQQFLTPSIIEGMEKKMFPEFLDQPGIHQIVRHRLRYDQMDAQQEVTQTRGWNFKKKYAERPRSILTRQVLINPVLHLAFKNESYAVRAASQHLCLCRNEDIVYPDGNPLVVNERNFEDEFGEFPGFELLFGSEQPNAFQVGYNRYAESTPMYGSLKVYGNPVNDY